MKGFMESVVVVLFDGEYIINDKWTCWVMFSITIKEEVKGILMMKIIY